jgi:molybdenum cofactor synthesis domain-containing protein
VATGGPRAAVISISSSRSAGAGPDLSGAALERFARGLGLEVLAVELIPDDRRQIEDRLRHYSDSVPCELILTTGGTGLSPSDVTPEATLAVLERQAPGIPHALREASRPHTSNWMLSRAQAGTRGASLIVNFPGSPASIEQAGEALAPALRHALALIAGQSAGH